MELEQIDGIAPDRWDAAIAPYPAAYFYHRSAWLHFLEETQGAAPLRFRAVHGGRTAGYFAALLLRKGPMKILGSPLSGWMTEYMGPVAPPDFDVPEFLGAVDRLCRGRGIHQIEMGSPLLPRGTMAEGGYETMEWMTFRIPLSADETRLWEGISGKARNRIRKARAEGLVVEETDDDSFADEHFQMLIDVYAKQGSAPPFPREYFRALRRHLKPADSLYCVRVRRGERTVASGFFPHDGRRVYSLSTASLREDQVLCPNELLHYGLMTLAGEAGVEEYGMGDNYRVPESGGRFKEKFNGRPSTVRRYVKSYSLLAKYGRGAYKGWMSAKRSVSDRWGRRAAQGSRRETGA